MKLIDATAQIPARELEKGRVWETWLKAKLCLFLQSWEPMGPVQPGQAHFLSQRETLQYSSGNKTPRIIFADFCGVVFWTTPWNRKPQLLLSVYRMEVDSILHETTATISAFKSA